VRFFNASSRGAPLFSARRGFRIAFHLDCSVATADDVPFANARARRNEDRPFARVIRD